MNKKEFTYFRKELGKTQKELAFICLSFAPFVGLFVESFYIKMLGFLLSLIALVWHRIKRSPRLFLTTLLTSSYIFGYFNHAQLFFMDQNFYAVVGVTIASYLISRLFWKQGQD